MSCLSADLIRIVVATDVHLGYLERDDERGHDSFLAFEEVLKTAREEQADMLLQKIKAL